MLKKAWRIWAKSLGEKVGETDRQANAIANHGWGLLFL